MLDQQGLLELTPSNWRFDAFHPLAGMAFVSRNGPNGSGEEVAYFGPPDFRAEPIGRSSLGLGATRGSFQSGLVIRGREVSFPSLAAAGEFVRRAYGRGTAGDDGGPPQGGGPQDEGPGPDGIRPDIRERWDYNPNEALVAVMADLIRFRHAIADCRFGEARPMTWFQGLTLETNRQAGDILLNGAAHSLCDALDQSTPNLSGEMRRSIRRLGAAFWGIGIAPHHVFETIRRYSPSYFSRFPSDEVRELIDGWHYARFNLRRSDPLDVLSELKGPLDLAGVQRPNDLLSWLSRFLATPDDILAVMPVAHCVERTVFAAAVIIDRRDWSLWRPDDEQLTMRSEHENAALAWLREHLPQMAYCQEYESALADMERPQQA